jgi:anti-sigma B factor antagonist
MGSELNLPQLTVVHSEQDGVQVVALSGELDLRAVGELEAALANAGADVRVCLDLTALEFIDSSGLATVIRGHQALTDGGGAFAVVCNEAGPVRRTFEMTGLMALLTVVADRCAALHALG